MSNHFAKNIMTRGNLNSSAITRGFILPFPVPDMIVRPRGYGLHNDGHSVKYEEPKKYPKIKDKEKEEKNIIVYINWNKYVDKFGISVYAELLKKKIEADLINTHVDEIKIIAEPLDTLRKNDIDISVQLDND